jgi:Cyclin, N-terminal domain
MSLFSTRSSCKTFDHKNHRTLTRHITRGPNSSLSRRMSSQEFLETKEKQSRREVKRKHTDQMDDWSTADASLNLSASTTMRESKRKALAADDLQEVKVKFTFEEALQSLSGEKKEGSGWIPEAEMEEEAGLKETQLPEAMTPHSTSSKMEVEEDQRLSFFKVKDASTGEEPANSEKTALTHQSKIISQVYAKRILFNLCSKEPEFTPRAFLERHSITQNHRARMADWMIEVLSNYSASQQTFFLAISILDRYFAKHPRNLMPAELHIAGCVSMLIASKYEEVHPMKLAVLVGKIAHNKISTENVLKLEQEMMAVIDFRPWAPTPYEMFCNMTSLLELRSALSTAQFKHFETTAVYLMKMAMYHYELISQHSYFEVMLGALAIALKTTQEALPGESLDMLQIVENAKEALGLKDDSAFGVASQIVFLAQNFPRMYPSLQNLAKFNAV